VTSTPHAGKRFGAVLVSTEGGVLIYERWDEATGQPSGEPDAIVRPAPPHLLIPTTERTKLAASNEVPGPLRPRNQAGRGPEGSRLKQ